jgi:hypothetical protein
VSDIIFLGVAMAFFALCAMYVRWCDHIIGSDASAQTVTDDAAPGDAAYPREVAA